MIALLLAAYAFCHPGYTATVRPPAYVTNRIKWTMLQEASPHMQIAPGEEHLPRQSRYYELDHIVPLELGGAPNSPDNFQLQSWTIARRKDHDENRLHKLVCAGRMDLQTAQEQMRGWKP